MMGKEGDEVVNGTKGTRNVSQSSSLFDPSSRLTPFRWGFCSFSSHHQYERIRRPTRPDQARELP